MFKNKQIKFFLNSPKKINMVADEASSPAVSNFDATDLYRNAVQSKINELMQTPDGEITEKRIQQFKLILDKLPEPEKVVSEIALSKNENNIIEKTTLQPRDEPTSQDKSSTLLQQIREKKLRPLQQQNKTEENNHAATNSLGNDPRKFSVNEDILSSVKLRQNGTTKYESSSNDSINNLSELEKKLARQRALLEKEIVNTESITLQENSSVNEDTNNNFSFCETKIRALSMIIEEVESQRNSIFFTLVNEEPATDSDSDNNDIQKELRELEEFKELEANIALEASLRQELAEAEKQLEEAFQSLMDCDNKNGKSIFEINAPISAYFKNSSSIDDSKPVIVGAVVKPKI